MKTTLIRSLFALLLLALTDRLPAQVFEFDIFKTTVYHQTNAAPPVTPDFPNAYFFASKLITDPSYNVTDIFVDSPLAEYSMQSNSTTFFTLNSPYFSTKTNFDAHYPSGEYDFDVSYLDVDGNSQDAYGYLIIPTQDLNAPNPAAFLTNCWPAMQQVYSGADFTLQWNSYLLASGADTAATFISVQDNATGNVPYGKICAPDVTTAQIPANSLLPGHSYTVNIVFSERNTTTGVGYGNALNIVGFDNLTYTSLNTLPGLQIAGAGANITLTWPHAATNYQLQATGSLNTNAVWNIVTNLPVVISPYNVLTLPATNIQRFFHLVSIGQP